MDKPDTGHLYPGYIYMQGNSFGAVYHQSRKYFNSYQEAETWILEQQKNVQQVD